MDLVKRHPVSLVALLLVLLCATACGGDSGATLSRSANAPVQPSATRSVQTYPPVTIPPAQPTAREVIASLRPLSPMPTPGNMPAGTKMREIQDRGRILLCTYDDVNLFAYADPLQDGKVVGFDMDIAAAVGRAIFGDTDPDRIQIVKISGGDRIPFVSSGKCDFVAATMTINADRITKVDFSEVYFSAGQRVLVGKNSPINGLQDLSGKRVCVQRNTTAGDAVPKLNPYAQLVERAQYTDCLLELQMGKVDAIASDDVILAGLAAQDPYTRLTGPQFTDEPYGIAVSKDNPELTRFINGVLAQLKSSGQWQRLYDKWLSSMGPAPVPPAGIYRD